MTLTTDSESLLKKHEKLVESVEQKVRSHIQRQKGEWYLNTIMLDNYDVAFRYRRKKLYKNLVGTVVNLSYYPSSETVLGMEVEFMKVVRLRRA
ncbi:hypothetical protein DBZ36_10700 [Alginatibacterium sediminis]|uniref:Uncharacterized protein n=1 Tax=Alginatibacterium sediminis TaxID=2164068 RepID=A0A420EDN7_9ALTE|nr:hypothetical protein [Alginatibacterium sediminis]RKF18849.1 hypothetical protein DBZ36_10700 [Alginatibacterium sediminis]